MIDRRIFPDLRDAPAAIEAKGGSLGRPFHLLYETTSTSDEAKLAAKRGAEHGSTWVAETQTSGRGRQGRSWLATPGEAILLSTLLRVSVAPSRLPPLALVAGLAVRDAIARVVTKRTNVQVKWPNDVLIDGRKVAGILVEATIAGARVEACIVGIGVNVHGRDFPPEIADRATSVALHTEPSGPPPDRGALVADILSALGHDAELVLHRGLGLVNARLQAHDALAGKHVRAQAGAESTIEGTAEGIDLEGRLKIRAADGVLHRVVAGEVHLERAP